MSQQQSFAYPVSSAYTPVQAQTPDASSSNAGTQQGVASTPASTPGTQLAAMAGTSTSASAAGTSAAAAAGQSRQAAEEARKDRKLAEFMLMLDEYEPLIPNEVTDYYLQRVGFECEDVRLKRLLSLAAQKFVSDIAADAYQHARIRTSATGGRARVNQPLTGPGSAKDKTRTTLTMDDLSAALAEYGISARKPEYYI
ncbi:transcription initiation factor IID, TAF10 subunit [Pholiota conissans]|uniref:Transcription initiation factor TFIID subunit 10 n=1 Tax=Pholiota conissans TaxID=109636 RepID=A0A9P6CNY4_9AGAR|nr:transcription initiation factor IID, TAF10 subunit [Pholiota conissans]